MASIRDKRRAANGGQRLGGDLPPNMDETMDDFQRESKKSLWHAFDMLDKMNTGSVLVSQLKVVTSTIGQKLGFNKAEEILNKDGVINMDFKTYFEIVKSELIDKQEQPDTQDEAFLGARLNDIITSCWTFCNFDRKHQCKSFTPEHCLILWRIYNFLSETDSDGDPSIPVSIDPEEAAVLLRDFIGVTGQRNKEIQVKQFLADSQDIPLAFADFLNVFEKDYVTSLSNKNISQGLDCLYDTYILNVLMKGMLRKRGFNVKSWNERWMVLTPTQLRYFKGSDEKILKGTILFDSECTVEIPADSQASKPNRFIVHTSKKPYEMNAQDLKTKNEWISAIQHALSRIGKHPNIQQDAAHERCKARAECRHLATEDERKRKEEAELLRNRQDELDEEKRKRLEDEELLRAQLSELEEERRKRLDDGALLRAQLSELEEERRKRLDDEALLGARLSELEEERRRRESAEARWQEEQALREAEHERLCELEAIKHELERLLADERQAKKDEEIVRALQSKLLEEEFEKREELERLKEQQEAILQAEREQKAVLESDRREQERLLSEAQARLEQLECDKAAAAGKMQEAAEKLQRAEKDRYIMEEKVKLWKTPVGLARPILPHVEPMPTHRGRGAFCDKDFKKTRPDLEKCEASHMNNPVTALKSNDIRHKSETHSRIDLHGDASSKAKSAEADDKQNAELENRTDVISDDHEEKEIKSGEEGNLVLINLKTEEEGNIDTGIKIDLQSDQTEKQETNCVFEIVDANLNISNAKLNYKEETNGKPEVKTDVESDHVHEHDTVPKTEVVNTYPEAAAKQTAESDFRTEDTVDKGENEIIKSETNYENISSSENQHVVPILEQR